jgi:hypothetical protein
MDPQFSLFFMFSNQEFSSEQLWFWCSRHKLEKVARKIRTEHLEWLLQQLLVCFE